MVDFSKLFNLLLKRGVHGPVIRLIYDGYERQQVSSVWNSKESVTFPVTNGVRQGAVASAVLFSVYMDDLGLRMPILDAT